MNLIHKGNSYGEEKFLDFLSKTEVAAEHLWVVELLWGGWQFFLGLSASRGIVSWSPLLLVGPQIYANILTPLRAEGLGLTFGPAGSCLPMPGF